MWSVASTWVQDTERVVYLEPTGDVVLLSARTAFCRCRTVTHRYRNGRLFSSSVGDTEQIVTFAIEDGVLTPMHYSLGS